MTIVAIHQPNFFPWLGFFDKIAKSDKFIFMDNVQFPETSHGNWLNRVKLFTGAGESWVTLPVMRRYDGFLPISSMKIHPEEIPLWKAKFLKTIQFNYGRHPYFKTVFELVNDCVKYDAEMLAEFNMRSIKKILDYVGLAYDHTLPGSTIECSGSATELLISMVKAVGGDAYMCGGGAGGYQEDALFAASGLQLIYQNFKHPVYPQKGKTAFVAGLSILDALFNCPPEQIREMLTTTNRLIE